MAEWRSDCDGARHLVDALRGDAGVRIAGAGVVDWPLVLASLLAAVGASAIALFVVSRKTMGVVNAVAGSVCMGGAIAEMHYTGMAAMRLPAMCHYSIWMVSVSVGFGDGDFAGGAAVDVLLPKGKERVQLVEGG